MNTNRVISFAITITAFVVVPIQMITTFVLGILVHLTFGLLLWLFSFIWIVLFFSPLMGLSYLWEHFIFTRPFASVLGIPFAIIGDIYTSLIPSMGEMDSRAAKLLCCQTFPYTWRYWQFQLGKTKLDSGNELYKVFQKFSRDKVILHYLDSLYEKYYRTESLDVQQ